MKTFVGATLVLSRWMDGVAGTALVFIMLLTSVDVVLRYLRHPIPGTYDIVSLAAAFVVGFAIPRTSLGKTHVTVDILVERLQSSKKMFEVGTRIMGIFFFLFLGWNLIKMGTSFIKTGDSTQTLALPFYPIAMLLGLCSFAECIVLVSEIARAIYKGEHDE